MMSAPEESAVRGSSASNTSDTAAPKDLPALDRLLHLPGVAPLVAGQGHTLVAGEARYRALYPAIEEARK